MYLAVGGTLIFVCRRVTPMRQGSLLAFFADFVLLQSSPFIDAVVDLSAVLKVSPTLLAFFLAPIASEMPEILEAISLSRKGHVQVRRALSLNKCFCFMSVRVHPRA